MKNDHGIAESRSRDVQASFWSGAAKNRPGFEFQNQQWREVIGHRYGMLSEQNRPMLAGAARQEPKRLFYHHFWKSEFCVDISKELNFLSWKAKIVLHKVFRFSGMKAFENHSGSFIIQYVDSEGDIINVEGQDEIDFIMLQRQGVRFHG